MKRIVAGVAAGVAVAALLCFLFFESRRSRTGLMGGRQPGPEAWSAIWGAPAKRLRFVSYNILHNERGMENVVAEIRKERPDFVLLQEVEHRDLSAMARALEMHPAVYHASENLAGMTAGWGNAILSTYPLYEGRTIPNPGGGSFGVWATAVVDDRKFKVASIHLSATWKANPMHLIESSNNRWKELSNLVKSWQEAGSPPIVLGGDFNQLPIHNNYELMTRHWQDALGAIGKAEPTFSHGVLHTRIDYFLVSKQWRVLAGGVGTSDASDHRSIWVEVGE